MLLPNRFPLSDTIKFAMGMLEMLIADSVFLAPLSQLISRLEQF